VLQALHIENYALIARLSIEFGAGLNLMTGETGSGKSIVVDALGLLLGAKGGSDLIRAGAERAVISGEFSVRRSTALNAQLEELGLELEDDTLLIRRELNQSGKARVFINDHPATVGALRTLAPWLAEIHGQNDQQDLFSSAAQLEMLDRAAQADAELAATAAAHERWRGARERLESFNRDEQEKLRLADLWGFQKKEIESVNPKPNEDADLEAEKRVLANAGKIHAALTTAFEQLYDAPAAAVASTASALRALDDIARFDPTLAPILAELRAAKVTLEESSFVVRDRMTHLNADPKRLEQLEDRLASLDRLKRKYGPGLPEVVAHREKVAQQLAELESSEELAASAARDVEAAAAAYRAAAATLSARRKDAAKRLEKAVQKNLSELAMEGTRFRVRFEEPANGSDQTNDWRTAGTDRVEFLISPNPGEPLHLLKDTASGGELSRLMLALELAAGVGGRGGTLVFDEVDAGIGGRVAETVGRKLKTLSAAHQVLCVTHLPQVAAFAAGHYSVEKRGEAGRTVTMVRLLDDAERPAEIARMLGGARVTDAALAHAADLLKTGRSV
jgi:DNA repair protein RecN (Recombination protein N)